MPRLISIAAVFLVFLCTQTLAETVRFNAGDGVEITAEFLKPEGEFSNILVLYHMAGASRGEYRDIAPVFNELGYATLAVDQRSGGGFNGVTNETASKAGGAVSYTKAIPDMLAAAEWARQNSGARQVGVLGSSYSAGLVLVLAAQSRDFADVVISFSPGEYFGSANFVSGKLKEMKVPVFLTSARNETRQWKAFEAKISAPVTGFVPQGVGRHGATTLVSADGIEYWDALKKFLSEHFPAR
ncbi:MAG: CocE/NonD family hydrolase [Pseudomonadota bacterium]